VTDVSERIVRAGLVTLLLFVAITAIFGAILVVPTLPIEWIKWGPFTDYSVPAMALGLVGLLSLIAAGGVLMAPGPGVVLAIAAGLAMATFEIVEVLVVGIALVEFPDLFQSWLQPIFFSIGVFIAALGVDLYRRMNVRPRLVLRSPA
jgi:hypothetical protein